MGPREKLTNRERHLKGAYIGQGFIGVLSAALAVALPDSTAFPASMIVSGTIMLLCEKLRLTAKQRREALLTDDEIEAAGQAIYDTQQELNKLMKGKEIARSRLAYGRCGKLNEKLNELRTQLLEQHGGIKRSDFKRQVDKLEQSLKNAQRAAQRAAAKKGKK